jgi:hypothetical protein
LFSAIAAIGLVQIVGCATATIEDAVPVAATQGAGQSDAAPLETAGDPAQAVEADLPATVAATPSGSPTAPSEVADAESSPALSSGNAQGTGRNTGVYPNLNIKPGVANTQITPAEKNASLAELEAKRRQQAARSAANRPAINQAKLKTLAATNADKVLKQIEGE